MILLPQYFRLMTLTENSVTAKRFGVQYSSLETWLWSRNMLGLEAGVDKQGPRPNDHCMTDPSTAEVMCKCLIVCDILRRTVACWFEDGTQIVALLGGKMRWSVSEDYGK